MGASGNKFLNEPTKWDKKKEKREGTRLVGIEPVILSAAVECSGIRLKRRAHR